MAYKYLKISSLIWGANNLTKEDLIGRKDGRYDHIINVENFTEYDPDKNEWVKIEGDK